jgi:hypothetical protein
MSFTNRFEPTHIYYDLQATSNDQLGNSIPQTQLTFNEIRSNPYINDPEEYYASIARFRVETTGISLPLMIPQMDTDQSEVAGNESVNRLIYTVIMRYGNNQFQQAVYFEPQNVAVVAPTSITTQDNSNGYYNLNSYQWFVNLVNKAFENCLAGLNAMAVIGNNIRPPFLQIDPNSNILQLFGQDTYYNDSLVNYVKVYFNESLYNCFSSFQVYNNGNGVLPTTGLTIREAFQAVVPPAVPASVITTTSKARYQLRFYYNTPRNTLNSFTVNDVNTPYNNTLPLANSYPYNAITMFQEYVSLASLCPVQSILFTSSLLPISPSLTGKPSIFNSNPSLVSSGNNANIVLQITDLELLNEKGNEYKPVVLYSPSPEYRLVDMFGNAPLHQIDIQVYWKDRFGNTYPLILTPSATASIKILFRKKSFNDVKEYNDGV